MIFMFFPFRLKTSISIGLLCLNLNSELTNNELFRLKTHRVSPNSVLIESKTFPIWSVS